MSMTREEAIERYEGIRYTVACFTGSKKDCDAVDMAFFALRPVSQELVEKAWMGCKYCDEEWGTCNPITNRFTMPPRGGIRFCPMCGRPLTDEAVDIIMRRLETLYETT